MILPLVSRMSKDVVELPLPRVVPLKVLVESQIISPLIDQSPPDELRGNALHTFCTWFGYPLCPPITKPMSGDTRGSGTWLLVRTLNRVASLLLSVGDCGLE